MSELTQYPVRVCPVEHNPKDPFAGDLFDRRKLADRLTGFVERMQVGCVFAIDAPWGEGKTWFGENWQSDLHSKGFRVARIDAFSQDYVDDPFLMLCSAILSIIHSDDDADKEKITKAGFKVTAALLPTAAKSLINLTGRIFLSSANLSDGIGKVVEEFNKCTADATEKHLEKLLEEHEADSSSVESFRKVLRSYTRGNGKPFVVIIDELDRCRPDFAVKTIERIKHFFDVDGMVFALLLNRPQLEAGVRGIYGSEVDAGTYLGKFVQFWLRLPKTASLANTSQDHNQIYCKNQALRFGLNRKSGHQGFQEAFAAFATLSGLSLRDLERGYTLFALAQPIDSGGAFAAWPVFLKLAKPAIFSGILNGEQHAHKEAQNIIAGLIPQATSFFILPVLADLHRCHIEGFRTLPNEQTRGVLATIGTWGMSPERFLPWLFGRIDLTVE